MASLTHTPLWQLRSLQTWVRQTLIRELFPDDKSGRAVQLGGAALDIGRWERAGARFLLSLEKDESHSADAEARWVKKKSPFQAQFTTFAFEQSLWSIALLTEHLGSFDMVITGDGVLEKTMCRSWRDLSATVGNIANLLKPGGFFVGHIFDSGEIWSRIAASAPSSSHSKNSFHTNGNLIRIEMNHFGSSSANSSSSAQDLTLLSPKPTQLASQWVQTAPTYGLDFSVTMENKTESLYLVHTQTLIEAAKAVGLRCLSLRNMGDFYETFKNREDEQLKRLVFNKDTPGLLNEQRDASTLFCVFVFQKTA